MLENTTGLRWIISAGGPLILMESSLLLSWKGVFGSRGEESQTSDYDRACAVDDYVGLIPVDEDFALVFGQEPMDTSWLPLSDTQGLIIRWVWANSEKQVEEVFEKFSLEQNWLDTGLKIEFKTENLILFDSASKGDSIKDFLQLNIGQGVYKVQTLFYVPNEEISLILHKVDKIKN